MGTSQDDFDAEKGTLTITERISRQLEVLMEERYGTLDLDSQSLQDEILLMSRGAHLRGDTDSAFTGLKIIGEMMGVIQTDNGAKHVHAHIHGDTSPQERKRLIAEASLEDLQEMKLSLIKEPVSIVQEISDK